MITAGIAIDEKYRDKLESLKIGTGQRIKKVEGEFPPFIIEGGIFIFDKYHEIKEFSLSNGKQVFIIYYLPEDRQELVGILESNDISFSE